jgi:hypothetical protein
MAVLVKALGCDAEKLLNVRIGTLYFVAKYHSSCKIH